MTRALAPLYAKLVVVAMIYGGQYPAGRYLAPYLPPYTSGALRYVIALGVLAVVVGRMENGWPRLPARDWGVMIVLGATGVFLLNAFFFASLEHITGSRAVLVSAFSPAAVAVGAWAVFGARLDYLRWIGIAIALFGVAVVVSQGDLASVFSDAIGIGDVYVFASMMSWVVYTLITRVVMRRFEPLQTVVFPAVAGAIMLVAGAIIEQPWHQIVELPVGGWVAIGYLGIIATVLPSLWFLQGVQRIGPTYTAIFMNLIPVFGVLWAWMVLDEALLPSLVIGGAIVLVGVALTNRPERAEVAAPSRA